MMALSCIIDIVRRLFDEPKIENDLVFTAPGPMKGSASDKGKVPCRVVEVILQYQFGANTAI